MVKARELKNGAKTKLFPKNAAQLADEPATGGEKLTQAGQGYGTAKVVNLGADDRAELGIAYGPFKVEIVDIDAILTFADGTKIIIPGMALAAFSGRKPLLVFTDKEVLAEASMADVGEIRESAVAIDFSLSSADAETPSDNEAKADGEKPPAGGAVQPGDAADAQQNTAAQEENKHKSDAEASRLTDKISSTQASAGAPANVNPPSKASDTPAPDDALGPAGLGKLVPTLQFSLFNKEGVTTTTESGVTTVTGSTGGAGSATNAAFAPQSAKETITGTASGDLIYADNLQQAPAGASLRVLTVEAMVPAGSLDLLQVTIPSLPDGYTIANAVKTERGWVVDIDAGSIEKVTTMTDATTGLTVPVPSSQSRFTFELELIYQVPADGVATASSGFQDEFFLPVQLGLSTDGKTSVNAVSVSTSFGIKVVAGDADMTVKNPVSGDPIYVLFSNPPGNVISAGDGDDTIVAGIGADDIDGGSGVDIVSYTNSRDAVTVDLGAGKGSGGAASGDTYKSVEGIIGSDQGDKLTGDAGANTIKGGKGADTIEGGAGIDKVDYSDAFPATGSVTGTAPTDPNAVPDTTGLEIFLDGTASKGGEAEGDQLTGIEQVVGSDRDDTITGAAANETLQGGAGNDVLVGGAGADRLDGGDGEDLADYSAATGGVTVFLDGRAGERGDAQGDVLAGIENLIGSAHDDALTGNADDNVIEGGAGADQIDGGAGKDTIDFSTSAVGVEVYLDGRVSRGGDAEGDTYANIENLIGSEFDDRLAGGTGAQTIFGGIGDDTPEGGAGADLLQGGDGTDIASYAGSRNAMVVSLDATQQSGDAIGDVYASIEGLEGSAFDDVLIGGVSADILIGGAGNDTLFGGAGADTLEGGSGFDAVDYSASFQAVDVRLDGTRSFGGDAQGDVITNVEHVTGSAFADTLLGNADVNLLEGGAGDDTLTGGGGADTLDGGSGLDTASYAGSAAGISVALDGTIGQGGDADGDVLQGIENLRGSAFNDRLTGNEDSNVLTGGAGDDTLVGGLGADTLVGGEGVDTADYSLAQGSVTVRLDGNASTGDDAEGDVLRGVERVVGSLFADVLIGSTADDVLEGGAGDDTLRGAAGADTLLGGAGRDTADYSDSAGAVQVNLATGVGLGGNAGNDSYSSIENVLGSDQSDVLTGGAGANLLDGGFGNDTLSGGDGADTLQGGGGSDIADYSASAAGVQISLLAGTAAGGDAQGDVLDGVEGIVGSAFADILTGDTGNNSLSGGVGDDTLTGGAGADVLDGGDGIDTADYSTSSSGITATLDGNPGQSGDAQGDSLRGIERLVGSSFADRLGGSDSADTLIGGLGDDTLQGMGGADVLDGGDGFDVVDYSSSDEGIVAGLDGRANTGGDAVGDVFTSIEGITGSDFADALYGSAIADALRSGGGDDTVYGSLGADTLVGGAGFDTADYGASDSAVDVNIQTGTGSGGHAEGDQLAGIERILGSIYDDTLTGGSAGDALSGGAGDDTLQGGGGADTLDGGAGTDTVTYALSSAGIQLTLDGSSGQGGDAEGDRVSNVERVIGSLYDDTIIGAGAAEVLEGGAGNDRLAGMAGNDTLSGGTGDDTLEGGAGEDRMLGGEGDDAFNGGAGADTLIGGTGFDTASYETSAVGVTVALDGSLGVGGDAQGDNLSGIERLVGSAFDDRLTGSLNADTLDGGAGNDTLESGAGSDLLTGGSGDDVLIGASGADTLDGGAGFDTVDYTTSSAGITAYLNGSAGLGGDATGDTLLGIEHVIGTGFNDLLVGASADELLQGGGGNDTLIGGLGADTLEGGAGVDTAEYTASASAVDVDLQAGTASGGDAQGDVLSSIEVLLGSSGDDRLAGTSANDTLIGGAGNDLLIGRDSNDDLLGGTGDDTLEGGAGADLLDGGTGLDTVDYTTSASAVSVGLDGTTGVGGDAQGDTLFSIENLTGSAFDDTLWAGTTAAALSGGAGNDSLRGSAGADRLDGGAGNDTLIGASGADRLDGGAGVDTTDYSSSIGGVTVGLDGSVGIGGEAEGDTLFSIEQITGSSFDDSLSAGAANSTLIGGLGSDTLNGGIGNDSLLGGGGDDVLTGNAGADTLTGGSGTDTANYNTAAAGVAVSLDGTVGSAGDALGDVLSGIEVLVGSAFADTLGGGTGSETIFGGLGDDRILGSASSDEIDGGDGNDLIDYSASANAVTVSLDGSLGIGGDASGDVLLSVEGIVGSAYDDDLTGGTANDTLIGGAGSDVLRGNAGADSLYGGVGDDTLDGGAGADLLDGGAGVDTVDYSASNAGVQVSVDGSVSTGGAAEGDMLLSIERLIGSSFNDTLQGTVADDLLVGGAGNDILAGGAGADTLDGGSGFDTADYSAAGAGVTASLAAGSGTVGDAAGDVLLGIERLVGSGFDDTLTAGAGGSALEGGAGADRLVGGAGTDTMQGGAGTDTLVGSAGADVIDGGTGDDTLDYAASNAAVAVRLDGRTSSGGAAEGDEITSVEVVIGSVFADTLEGSAGNETLIGGAGADTLVGAGGADRLDGGTGTDTADYAQSGAAVGLSLASGGFAGDANGDTFVSIETVVGSDFDDTI
uniref:calcium-binding protein n=2 Tax=unclassified Novosphingobium TaxID=2644732 RepID=UPI00260C08C0